MAVNTMEPIKRQEQVTVPQRNKRALRLRAEHSRSWLLISAAWAAADISDSGPS
jgi:hypothetical protein